MIMSKARLLRQNLPVSLQQQKEKYFVPDAMLGYNKHCLKGFSGIDFSHVAPGTSWNAPYQQKWKQKGILPFLIFEFKSSLRSIDISVAQTFMASIAALRMLDEVIGTGK